MLSIRDSSIGKYKKGERKKCGAAPLSTELLAFSFPLCTQFCLVCRGCVRVEDAPQTTRNHSEEMSATPVLLVVAGKIDGADYHMSRTIAEYLAETNANVEVELLPLLEAVLLDVRAREIFSLA